MSQAMCIRLLLPATPAPARKQGNHIPTPHTHKPWPAAGPQRRLTAAGRRWEPRAWCGHACRTPWSGAPPTWSWRFIAFVTMLVFVGAGVWQGVGIMSLEQGVVTAEASLTCSGCINATTQPSAFHNKRMANPHAWCRCHRERTRRNKIDTTSASRASKHHSNAPQRPTVCGPFL